MKNKKHAGISATLATATCALLGTYPSVPVSAQELDRWEFDTSLLYYGEDNSRIQDASLGARATRNFLDDRSLTIGLTVDALTGATPHGRSHRPARDHPAIVYTPSQQANCRSTTPLGIRALR